MKLVITICSLVTISSMASASDEGTLLSLTKGTGYVPEPMSQYSSCSIVVRDIQGVRSLEVKKERKIGAFRSTSSKEVSQLTEEDVKKIIELAAAGTVVTSIGPVDGPTTIYTAYVGKKEIPLLSQGTGENKENSAWESRTLMNLLEYHCENKPVH